MEITFPFAGLQLLGSARKDARERLEGSGEENALLICSFLLAGGPSNNPSSWQQVNLVYSFLPHHRGASPSQTVPLLRGLN